VERRPPSASGRVRRPARSAKRAFGTLLGGLLLSGAVLASGPAPAALAAPASGTDAGHDTARGPDQGTGQGTGYDTGQDAGAQDGSPITALDFAGPMAAPGGPGRPRTAAARTAIGSFVDSPPVSRPTGPRVHGAGRTHGPSRPGADAYRFLGTRITGGATPRRAAAIRTGQYLDTIGPGETRWYAATLDAVSTADLSVTAVPQPGAAVDYGDGLELRLTPAGTAGVEARFTCDSRSAHFAQNEGAMTFTGAVSRIPSHDHDGLCDKAGSQLLSVHRTSAAASDRGRWPIELRFDTEAPLPAGTVPAAARTEYGVAPAPVTGTPKDLTGGTGFNDAARVTTGVWRDRLLPARSRYYKVHVGWGQQLTYTAEFAGGPVPGDSAAGGGTTFVATSAYAPGRLPLDNAAGGRGDRSYDGSPVSVGLGTVPVSWTNRWVNDGTARAVHRSGDYWIAVGLGPGAARLAKNAAVGVILRVQVTGEELSGPRYRAPPLARRTGRGKGRAAPPNTRAAADGSNGEGGGDRGRRGGVSGTDLIAAGTGGGVALAGMAGVALAHRTRNRTTRGGA
jgi:Ca-activated chloride channel family protein